MRIPYLLRRVLYSVFLLAGASVLAFVLINLAPGDFFDELRLNPEVSAKTVDALRSGHQLDQALPVRYLRWVRSVASGDWGFSLAYDGPAGPILRYRAGNTLLLTGTAMLLAWLIALPCGIWAAARFGKTADVLTSGMVSVLLAVPEIVLALLFLLFAVRTGYLPAGGMASLDFSGMDTWNKARDLARHLALPSLCLAAGFLPMLLSHVRAAMAEVLESRFITAARGYGIPFRRILFRHALPAAANPLISLLGFSIGIMLSSSLLIEAIFSWPGLGQLLLEAIVNRDFLLVIDAAVLATMFLIAGNLIADVLLYSTDPRIRAE